MKKLFPLLLALALLLSGCGRREETPPDPVQDPPAGTEEPSEVPSVTDESPLELDILRIEICRSGLGSDRLMEAVRTLPELLRSALADQNIITNAVQVTIGSSPAATVQALNEGTVDIAILPAGGFAGQETEAAVLLASGPQSENDHIWREGYGAFRGALYASAASAGGLLDKEGALPAWEELDHLRWGLLGQDSIPGRRAVDLWLADHYEGRTTAELSHAAVYETFDQLLQAAEAGEIDLFPLDDITSGDWQGASRFYFLGELETFYDTVAVVSPRREDLSDPERNLRDPLMFTLTRLCFYDGTQTDPGGLPAYPGEGYDRETRELCQDVFGPYRYGWARDEDLDATRRLMALEGHTAD